MKPAVLAATLAAAVGGWWLPSLWQKEAPRAASSILPPPRTAAAVSSGAPSLAANARRAGSAMAQFQAVVDGVSGRGASLAFRKDSFTGLTCDEAEELAAALAGEETGRAASDGAALLRSFKDMDYRAATAALDAWAEKNPDAALRTLLTHQGGNFTGLFGQSTDTLRRLVARDPAKALEILRAAPGHAALADAWDTVLSVCAEKGPEFALPLVLSAPFRAQHSGLDAILRVMAKQDPQAALAWMEAQPAEVRARMNQETIYEEWAARDPSTALPLWLAADPKTLESNGDMGVTKWAEKDPEALLRWTQESAAGDIGGTVFGAMRELTRRDPQHALALLETVKPEQRGAAISSIAETWAAQDFPAALAWTKTLSDETMREGALRNLAIAARQLPEPEQRAWIAAVGATTPIGFSLLADLDPAEALRTFTTMPAGDRTELYRQVDDFPPAEAARFLQLLPPGGNADRYVASLATTWSHSDPAAAAAWVNTLPPGEAQNWGVANLIANWSRHDLSAATAWTHQLPPGPARDKAEEQLAALASNP